MEYLALIISFLAVAVAFWQGYLAKLQLDNAKTTKGETEKLLDQIKDKVIKIESISDETRKKVEEQVNKLIDNQNKHFETLLNNPKESQKTEMAERLITSMLASPEKIESIQNIAEIAEKLKKMKK